jgi:hypothetical protein
MTEETLQDFLDGRLTGERRVEFEAQLESDAELAERVEAYRELGRALREEEPALSPGFYTRTRARFEQARRGRLRMPRLLSWEVAGLAAAVTLAGVLFIPGLIDRSRQGEPFPATETTWEVKEPAAGIEEPSPEPELRTAAEIPAAEQLDDAMIYEGEKMEKKAAPLPAAEPHVAPSQPPAAKGDEKRGRAASLGMKEATPWKPEILRLPAGAVDAGAVIVIETEREWLSFVKRTDLDIVRYDPGRRLVLIGARAWPFQCEEITVDIGALSYRITLRPPTEPRLAAEWGCAVIVDRDHRAIEVMPPLERQP